MKKFKFRSNTLKFGATSILAICFATTVSAIQMTDEHLGINYIFSGDGQDGYRSVDNGTSFDFSADIPGSYTAVSGEVAFEFFNPDSGSEIVVGVFDEVGLWEGLFGGFTTTFGFNVFGGEVSGSVIGELNDTGILNYSIAVFGGDGVMLVNSRMTVEATANALIPDGTVSVPDAGSALMLFGAALASLGAFACRKK